MSATDTDREHTNGRLHRRSTIKDVAAEAQVSISTVSLVMNEREGVSQDTRDRVIETARRLGYVPTVAARHLVRQRTGHIGFVAREDHFTRSEPFYTRIFLGTEFEARHEGSYVLLTTVPGTYRPGEDTPRFLREHNVDGLLVAGKVDARFLDEAQEAEVPVVLIDFEYGGLPAVVIDNVHGARAAVEHLIGRGHRHVAFVGADLAHPSLAARLDGYRLALGAAGAEHECLIVADDGEPDRRTGRALAERLFALDPAPTAAFCVNDAVALGVLDYCGQHGIAVPGTLAVAGFDDVDGADTASPPLTTVHVPKEQIGEVAFRHLIERIENLRGQRTRAAGRREPAIAVPTELVVRAST